MVIITGRETHRLCKGLGVKRVSDSTVPALNEVLAEFCDMVIKEAISRMLVMNTKRRTRQTIRGPDIAWAGKHLLDIIKRDKDWLPDVDLTPIPIPDEE